MSPETQTPENHVSEPSEAPTTAGAKKPWLKRMRCLGIGCLSIILFIGAGIMALYISGIFSGTPGNIDAMPAWSSDGSRIAFVSNRDGNSDIFVMNVDGTHVRQLTHDRFARLYLLRSPIDISPTWSPDSKQIAFSSARDNRMMASKTYNIFVMNADGSDVVNLRQGLLSVDLSPSWSPDGQKIAFISGYIPGDLEVIDTDGAQETDLISTSSVNYGIAWSPDSRSIIFSSDHDGTFDLYVMNADGSNIVQLTDGPATDWSPAWSPDGSRIAFSSDRGGKGAIYVMNADGSNIAQLTDDKSDAAYPSWSPDSQRIAYTSNLSVDPNIYVINADGSNVIQLTGK